MNAGEQGLVGEVGLGPHVIERDAPQVGAVRVARHGPPPRRIGELHRSLRVAAGELDQWGGEVARVAIGRPEPVGDHVSQRPGCERTDVDQLGLTVERSGDVGEHRPHQRQLRPGEHQPDVADVVLQFGAQQAGGAVEAVDAAELVEHDEHRVLAGGGDEPVEKVVDHRHRIGLLGWSPGEHQLDRPEVDLAAGDEVVESVDGRAAHRGERPVEADGEVGHRRDLVEVDVDHGGAGGLEFGPDPPEHARLAEPARPEHGRDTSGADALDQVGDEVVAPPHIDGVERPLEWERGNLHAEILRSGVRRCYVEK